MILGFKCVLKFINILSTVYVHFNSKMWTWLKIQYSILLAILKLSKLIYKIIMLPFQYRVEFKLIIISAFHIEIRYMQQEKSVALKQVLVIGVGSVSELQSQSLAYLIL